MVCQGFQVVVISLWRLPLSTTSENNRCHADTLASMFYSQGLISLRLLHLIPYIAFKRNVKQIEMRNNTN